MNDKETYWFDPIETPPEGDCILVLVEGDQHLAYWCKDCQGYKTGVGFNCYYCGGQTFIEKSKRKGWEDRPFMTHWRPWVPYALPLKTS